MDNGHVLDNEHYDNTAEKQGQKQLSVHRFFPLIGLLFNHADCQPTDIRQHLSPPKNRPIPRLPRRAQRRKARRIRGLFSWIKDGKNAHQTVGPPR
jgi:hypothetical protein